MKLSVSLRGVSRSLSRAKANGTTTITDTCQQRWDTHAPTYAIWTRLITHRYLDIKCAIMSHLKSNIHPFGPDTHRKLTITTDLVVCVCGTRGRRLFSKQFLPLHIHIF